MMVKSSSPPGFSMNFASAKFVVPCAVPQHLPVLIDAWHPWEMRLFDYVRLFYIVLGTCINLYTRLCNTWNIMDAPKTLAWYLDTWIVLVWFKWLQFSGFFSTETRTVALTCPGLHDSRERMSMRECTRNHMAKKITAMLVQILQTQHQFQRLNTRIEQPIALDNS